jgi:hypothetical protein
VLEVRDWQQVKTSFQFSTDRAKWYVIPTLTSCPKHANVMLMGVDQDLDERRKSTTRSLQKITTSWTGIE